MNEDDRSYIKDGRLMRKRERGREVGEVRKGR